MAKRTEDWFCDRYCFVEEDHRHAKNQFNLGCEGAYCDDAKAELEIYAKDQKTILNWLKIC